MLPIFLTTSTVLPISQVLGLAIQLSILIGAIVAPAVAFTRLSTTLGHLTKTLDELKGLVHQKATGCEQVARQVERHETDIGYIKKSVEELEGINDRADIERRHHERRSEPCG